MNLDKLLFYKRHILKFLHELSFSAILSDLDSHHQFLFETINAITT